MYETRFTHFNKMDGFYIAFAFVLLTVVPLTLWLAGFALAAKLLV